MSVITGEKTRGVVDLMCLKGVMRVHAVNMVVKRLKGIGMAITCERCNKEVKVVVGSYFDNSMICEACNKLEQKHTKYDEAKGAAEAASDRGSYSYPGIGLPTDWKEFVKENEK